MQKSESLGALQHEAFSGGSKKQPAPKKKRKGADYAWKC